MLDTMQELIEAGQADPYNLNNMSYWSLVKTDREVDGEEYNFVVSVETFIDKYYDIIMRDYVEDMEMSESDFVRYMYNPKMLSYDSFGTTELWHIILRINNMSSVLEFNKRKIKMFTDSLIEVLDEIINLEEEEKDKNTEEIINNI